MAMTENAEKAPDVKEQVVSETPNTQKPPHNPYNTGRWTDQEHEDFINGLRRYGKNWDMLAYSVKTRSATQVRSHAQKFFLKCASKYKRKIEPEYVSLKQNTAVLDLCISPHSNKVPKLEGTLSPQYETMPLNYRSERGSIEQRYSNDLPRLNYTWSQCQLSQPGLSEQSNHNYAAKQLDFSYPTKSLRAVESVRKPTIQRYSSLLSELSLYEAETKESFDADLYLPNDHAHAIEPLPYNRDVINGMADMYGVDYNPTELLI